MKFYDHYDAQYHSDLSASDLEWLYYEAMHVFRRQALDPRHSARPDALRHFLDSRKRQRYYENAARIQGLQS